MNLEKRQILIIMNLQKSNLDFINFEIYKNKLIKETNETNINDNYITKEEVILIKKESLALIGYYSIINIINKYIQTYGKMNQNQLIDNIFNNLNINDIQLLKQEFNKIGNNNINLDDILPKPDSLIRIFLSIKKIDAPINIKEQKLQSIERKGFTVIEWGGSDLNKKY